MKASGRLGTFLFKALQQSEQFEITIISRRSSTSVDYPLNTKVVQVGDDYPDKEMIEAFRGIDAVVLSLGFAAEHRLPALARASVGAGVKRLIASGYGVDASDEEAAKIFPVAATKAAMIKDLRSLETPGWSWTEVACGLFLDL